MSVIGNHVEGETKSDERKAHMNEEQDGTRQTAEQWAAFQQIWGETFSKLMELGFTFTPESAPPEFMRRMRGGIFEALGKSWEQFLRSPQFMEGMKQHMDNAIAFRKMSSDFFSKVRHETQNTSRDDIDAVMLAVRHMETRILDRVERLAAKIEHINPQANGAKPKARATPKPKRKVASAKKSTRRKT
jgi:hypothetical protein